LAGVLDFAKKFRNLTDPSTYASAIELHEQKLASDPA
jgi:hypothetical protein